MTSSPELQLTADSSHLVSGMGTDLRVNLNSEQRKMDYSPLMKHSSDSYRALLPQIAWNIRRTLDLSTIWQQTVKGLGTALDVSRCVICAYKLESLHTEVVAEYAQDGTEVLLGQTFYLAQEPHLYQALNQIEPIAAEWHRSNLPNRLDVNGSPPAMDDRPAAIASTLCTNALNTHTLTQDGQSQSMLVVATCYQDQPNGLICLYQNDCSYVWSEAEVELVRELADQVGTAIAHATLFSESQALATELQRVNDDLMQKHQELEEAHKHAEEASRLKSEFLANTSHELRTPLNGMLGFLRLVMDGMADDPEEQKEFIHEAHRSALHLLNIINDILDIAKIEAGKMQLELNPCKLDELLNHVGDFTRTQAQQKRLNFEMHKPRTRDEIILYGNYQRLLQVMLNLVGNAIKFTHEGGVTISVEITKQKAAVQDKELPGMVKVRVADTGIGVSLDKQDKLFQSFSQVDGSRTRQYGGTGLGLTISQKLVEAMGGVVHFYSMGEGLGSTVTFTVPLYQEPIMIAASALETIDSLIS